MTTKREREEAAEQEARDERIRSTAIVRTGDQITVPDEMELQDAISALRRKLDEEEQVVSVEEVFNVSPLEGALAWNEALVEKYKWVSMQTKKVKGFFGDMDIPPRIINVPIDLNKTAQVPWGEMVLPGIEGTLETQMDLVKRRPVFKVSGQIKYKSKALFAELCAIARRYLKENSIYKGKAIRANFPDLEDATSPEDFFPEFMNLTSVDESQLVFSKHVEHQIGVTLFTPIERTKMCRESGIPLKRGILLEGPFGVGKTLTAHVTAKKCVDNGWTFVYINSVNDLADAIEFARQYQPAVVFSEDLDQAIKGEHRSEKIDHILNTIDGIDSKGTEIVVVLTTNNVQDITQAMLRPGRLDSVITVEPPDAAAVQKLVRTFAGSKIADTEDLTEVGQLLAGRIPAFIGEAVQRSALAAIYRSGSSAQITADDLVLTAKTMFNHLKLLEPKPKDTRSDIEKAADILASSFSDDDLQSTMAEAQSLLNGLNGERQQSAVDVKQTEAETVPVRR